MINSGEKSNHAAALASPAVLQPLLPATATIPSASIAATPSPKLPSSATEGSLPNVALVASSVATVSAHSAVVDSPTLVIATSTMTQSDSSALPISSPSKTGALSATTNTTHSSTSSEQISQHHLSTISSFGSCSTIAGQEGTGVIRKNPLSPIMEGSNELASTTARYAIILPY